MACYRVKFTFYISFFLSKVPDLMKAPTMGTGSSFLPPPGIKLLPREAGHSPLTNAEVTNRWY
jgi:hypothetical protein